MLHLAAILIALGAGLTSGRLQGSAAGVSPRVPRATLATAVIVATMFAAQLAIPSLLPLLSREPSLLQSGQLWRALTALFVQDYGLAGALVNLATLLILGSVAEKRLGSVTWLVVYFGGGVITEFLALAWQPHGAGNSIACFALAGGLTLRAIKRTMGVVELGVCIVSLGAGVTLLLLRDIHGLGYWAGVACAFAGSRLHELPWSVDRVTPKAH
jgi:membrane associated rhomboid family serine protease